MPRKKITSRRNKKADQLLKRAVKRGEAAAPEPKKPGIHKKLRKGPTGYTIGASDNVKAAQKLQSAFIRLPPHFLETTKDLASNLRLNRPIDDQKAIFHDFDHDGDVSLVSCPKRPKWRFDMSKQEVESNEEGNYKKWLAQTEEALDKWQNKPELPDVASDKLADNELRIAKPQSMPRSPSYFERNLEVWRQLWRVAEISQIILVLLDSRCPTLHYPPSLSDYLGDRKIILVLTKVDIAGPARVQAWIRYIHAQYPGVRIVQVESYIEKEISGDHQGRKQLEPSIPRHFREMLVQVIKEVHAELLEPPDIVKNNPAKLSTWVPPVKREIDWKGVMEAKGEKVGLAVGGAAAPKPGGDESHRTDHPDSQRQEPSYLTVGLIGQPNVGKSSLLNALFGARKVRASKTAGKTKHFQTLYWTPDVRLVDCPGLVMPNYVPMEMQVLCGILPISRVSAVPACIYYASQLLPLERIYNLVHPSTKLAPVEDKRTWRDGRKPDGAMTTSPVWTAMDILTAYADAKGWVTAQAGRPDVHRAGNAILRSLAEGRIGWAFWPPDTPLDEIASATSGEQGIWIPRGDVFVDESSGESEAEEHEDDSPSTSSEEDEEEDEEEEEGEEEDTSTKAAGVGRFGALALTDVGEEDDDSSEGSSD